MIRSAHNGHRIERCTRCGLLSSNPVNGLCCYCREGIDPNGYERREDNALNGQDCIKSLYPHDYKPPAVFHREPAEKTEVFYGIELEFEFESSDEGENAIDDIRTMDPGEERFYCKNDGSLGPYGVELVSHPRTMGSWLTSNLGDYLEVIKSYGGKPTVKCGLHVHRSRSGITEIDVTKLIICMIKFRTELEKIGGRRANNYCRFDDWETTPKDIHELWVKRDGKSKAKRYVALNISNPETLEFRFFSSSVDENHVMACIEFTDLFVSWVTETSIARLVLEDYDHLWEEFRQYTKTHRAKYFSAPRIGYY
jgi:hypothetical protein